MSKEPKVITINNRLRTANIRYKDTTVMVTFHKDGELDWENFGDLSSEEFNELICWVYESKEIIKAFPCLSHTGL